MHVGSGHSVQSGMHVGSGHTVVTATMLTLVHAHVSGVERVSCECVHACMPVLLCALLQTAPLRTATTLPPTNCYLTNNHLLPNQKPTATQLLPNCYPTNQPTDLLGGPHQPHAGTAGTDTDTNILLPLLGAAAAGP